MYIFALIFAWATVGMASDAKLDAWIKDEVKTSYRILVQNITQPGAQRGAVAASPSKTHPDYYYHWVRDAALVMDEFVTLLEGLRDRSDRNQIKGILASYVTFSRGNQLTTNLSGGLGEPKFGMDGIPYPYEWARPQNDGPALRAIVMTRFAWSLLGEGRNLNHTWVRQNLYDGKLPSFTLLKNDLEYVSHHWSDASFDLWEEVYGYHFYTRMVQRRALLDGAILADHLGDGGAAEWYRRQAALLQQDIEKHWDAKAGLIVPTLLSNNGLTATQLGELGSGLVAGKEKNLDVAVILAILHAGRGDGFFEVYDDRVLSSALKIEEGFISEYDLNKENKSERKEPSLGTAIGRYPEDIYDGYSSSRDPAHPTLGNPWILATAAFAELYYKLEKAYLDAGVIRINSTNIGFFTALMGPRFPLKPNYTYYKGDSGFTSITKQLAVKGDGFLQRIQAHTPADGRLSEQYNRLTGFMQGAFDLSWSHGSLITAVRARSKVEPEPTRNLQGNTRNLTGTYPELTTHRGFSVSRTPGK